MTKCYTRIPPELTIGVTLVCNTTEQYQTCPHLSPSFFPHHLSTHGRTTHLIGNTQHVILSDSTQTTNNLPLPPPRAPSTHPHPLNRHLQNRPTRTTPLLQKVPHSCRQRGDCSRMRSQLQNHRREPIPTSNRQTSPESIGSAEVH